jgi:hypothetical protein
MIRLEEKITVLTLPVFRSTFILQSRGCVRVDVSNIYYFLGKKLITIIYLWNQKNNIEQKNFKITDIL